MSHSAAKRQFWLVKCVANLANRWLAMRPILTVRVQRLEAALLVIRARERACVNIDGDVSARAATYAGVLNEIGREAATALREGDAMSRAHDLTPAALEGYRGDRDGCPYLATSPNWYAYHAGYWAQWRGMPEPSDVRMGRGCKVRIRDLVVEVTLSKGSTRPRIERIA